MPTKTGPCKTDLETLIRRGSRLAKGRIAELKRAEAEALGVSPLSPPDEGRGRQVKTRPKLRLVRPLPEIIKILPDFDPYKDAEDYYFDVAAAQKAIHFIETELVHVKGSCAGKPFILEPWERAVIANIFGWKHKITHLRRFREIFIMVPRKNGKTPLIAAIIVYLLFEDGEPGAEIYGAASEYKQASLVWEHARGMVERNPKLEERCSIYTGTNKGIELNSDHSMYRVISSDAFSKHGYNSSAVIIDELHALPDRELVDVLTTSTGARSQPLVIYITTSDFERESICNEKEDYAHDVAKGKVKDPNFLPVVYKAREAKKGEPIDWHSQALWKKVNPNFGVSISAEYLEREHLRACRIPAYENTFKRLHLNIRTASESMWVNMDFWDMCNTIYPIGAFTGMPCYIGIDLSSVQDLTAVAVLFPRENMEKEEYVAFTKFWLPKERLQERIDADKRPYDVWAEEGHVELTPGNVITYQYQRAYIRYLFETFEVKEIAYDPYNFEAVRQDMISEDGIPEDIFVAFGQGFPTMSAPCNELERLIIDGKFVHNCNPVLRWNMENVVLETDAFGNKRPAKKKTKNRRRIDGVVANLMALGRAMLKNDASNNFSNEFRERGLLSVNVG